jgi:hypothetical protein
LANRKLQNHESGNGLAKAFAITEGLLSEDESFDRWFKFVTRETGLIVGVLLVLVGLILGATQKAWFKDQLRRSTATWKIWGNSEGAPDWRSDPQNLPPGLTKEIWTKTTYALMSSGDYGSAYRCIVFTDPDSRTLGRYQD